MRTNKSRYPDHTKPNKLKNNMLGLVLKLKRHNYGSSYNIT